MAEDLGQGESFRREQYDWDRWLSGNQFRLRKGVDYSCKSASIIRAARYRASLRGIRVETQVKRYPVVDNEVIFDPDPMTDYGDADRAEFVLIARKDS